MKEDEVPLLPESDENGLERKAKRRKPGIVYLSTIPPNMNVSKIRQYFAQFGDLDRVFLQATQNGDKPKGPKKYKKKLHFTEGWIEFKSKRKAKKMHLFLNNQPVGGKKKNPYYDMLWNIKYLPRFKWAYLKQRLEYEREVMRQRLGAEISQVRRETDHFLKVSEISEQKKRKKKKLEKAAKGRVAKEGKGEEGEEKQKKEKEGEKMEDRGENKQNKGGVFIFKQKETEQEKLSKREERKKKNELFRKRIANKKKRKQKLKAKKPEDFLGSVFVGAS